VSTARVPDPLGYDFEERHVEVEGVDLAYVDEGPRDATPLLLVHGLGATLDHWALAIPRLARKRRVVALDLPGFGRSAKPDRPYGPQDFVTLLGGFTRALGLEHIALAGHSMGGAVCAEFALSHPFRVSRLVLVDAAGMTRMPTRLLDFLVHRFERRIDPKRVTLPPRLVRAMVKLVFFEPIPFADRNVGRILASMSEADWPDRVRSFVRAATGLSRSQVRARLADIRMPTLILWGERDRILPVRHGRALAGGIAGSKLHVFPRCGHCPQIEKPDEFCEVVEGFLE
jgi:pimeloyl-ACP methyl ester carboxylesterase